MSETTELLRKAVDELAVLRRQAQEHEREVHRAFKLGLMLAAPRGCSLCNCYLNDTTVPSYPMGTKVSAAEYREDTWKHLVDVRGVSYYMACECGYIHTLLTATGSAQILERLKDMT